MKVRISNNKIRFRLKEPEVNRFRETGSISELLEFGAGDRIAFTLSKTEDAEISIAFSSGETTIFVPAALSNEWTDTELVGFDSELDTGKGKKIYILVEKDFMCMDGRVEDNIGSYPNPLAGDAGS